ncbi:MAG: aldehyde dehydrogenase family protein [Niameybacter sp.]
MISKEAADFVCELIEEAIDKGGKCLVGGSRSGNAVEPTLIDCVEGNMRLP